MPVKVIELLPDLGVGGAERLVLDICRTLDRERYDVTLVSLFSQANAAPLSRAVCEQAGLRCVFLDKQPGLDLKLLGRLTTLYRQVRPDVVHSHLYAGVYSLWAARRAGVPVSVHTVHTLADKEMPSLHKRCMRHAYRAGRVAPVAISPQVQQSLYREYGLPADRVVCIDNGIDIARFTPPAAGLAHDGFRFISVGRLCEAKNQHLLIEAFAQVHRQLPDATLTIVGEGPLRAALEQQVAQAGLSDCVSLPGISDDVPGYLHRSDVFVFSSDYEGVGLVLMEAMAAGLPVVSTAAGGVANVVTDGQNGFLTPVGDATALAACMTRLASDDTLRGQMAAAARKRAVGFDIGAMTRQYAALFDELLAKQAKK